MAKKGKKSKRRRHQLKKSKKGQVRKRHPKVSVVRHSELGPIDNDEELSDRNVVFVKSVGRDVPVTEDGYRIVGPAQAMMDYAKPLIDEAESEEDMDKALKFAQLCWTLAVIQDTEPEKAEEMRQELVNDSDVPEMGSLVDMMVGRYYLMFPEEGKTPSFYMKERVIDIERFKPFDESTVHIKEDRIPPTKDEMKLARRLQRIDPSEDEAELSEWQDDVVSCYAEWCFAKDVPSDRVDDFAYAVSAYLGFLSSYYEEAPSSDTPTEAVQEFMRTFFIRKTWMESGKKSVMPCALKLFMQYLDEKGIVSGTQRIREIIESEQDTFLENLKLYTDPSLGKRGRKIIPFRRKLK